MQSKCASIYFLRTEIGKFNKMKKKFKTHKLQNNWPQHYSVEETQVLSHAND